jgi:hypothetical protein
MDEQGGSGRRAAGAKAMTGNVGSVTFFYPARKVGGTELLFIRLAKYLSAHHPIDVNIIDYRDGFMRRESLDDAIGFLEFEDGAVTRVDFPTCVVAPFSCLFRLNNELALNEESRVLFWVLHPYNFLMLMPFISTYQHLRMELIKCITSMLLREDVMKIQNAAAYLSRHNALYSMDSDCLELSKHFFDLTRATIPYLPATTLDKESAPLPATAHSREVHIGWLGRLSQEKVYPLLNIIENADAYSLQHRRPVVMHIIGEGGYDHLVNAYERRSEALRIVFAGTILGNKLDSYLTDNVDVLFAMGTSCFEGAQLRLPTVLVGASFQKIKREYRYKWLYETEGYSLGGYANREHNPHSFEEIMSELYDRNRKGPIGEANYRYFVDNHSMARVSGIFLECVAQDTATLRGLDEETSVFRPSTIMRAYGAGVRGKNKLKQIIRRH